MKIGMQLHADRGYASVIEAAHHAAEQGFDSVWLSGHMIESWGVNYMCVNFPSLESLDATAELLPRLDQAKQPAYSR